MRWMMDWRTSTASTLELKCWPPIRMDEWGRTKDTSSCQKSLVIMHCITWAVIEGRRGITFWNQVSISEHAGTFEKWSPWTEKRQHQEVVSYEQIRAMPPRLPQYCLDFGNIDSLGSLDEDFWLTVHVSPSFLDVFKDETWSSFFNPPPPPLVGAHHIGRCLRLMAPWMHNIQVYEGLYNSPSTSTTINDYDYKHEEPQPFFPIGFFWKT